MKSWLAPVVAHAAENRPRGSPKNIRLQKNIWWRCTPPQPMPLAQRSTHHQSRWSSASTWVSLKPTAIHNPLTNRSRRTASLTARNAEEIQGTEKRIEQCTKQWTGQLTEQWTERWMDWTMGWSMGYHTQIITAKIITAFLNHDSGRFEDDSLFCHHLILQRRLCLPSATYLLWRTWWDPRGWDQQEISARSEKRGPNYNIAATPMYRLSGGKSWTSRKSETT